MALSYILLEGKPWPAWCKKEGEHGCCLTEFCGKLYENCCPGFKCILSGFLRTCVKRMEAGKTLCKTTNVISFDLDSRPV